MGSIEKRAKTVFLQAHGLPEDEREAFVARECAGDDELAERVRGLLAADGPASRAGQPGTGGRLAGGEQELWAVDLDDPESKVFLWAGPHIELDVAPDRSAVAFSHGPGHMGMGLSILKLRPPAEPAGLPTADGEPIALVPAIGTWHVHQPSWSPDSKSIVYTEDEDFGDVIELVPNR